MTINQPLNSETGKWKKVNEIVLFEFTHSTSRYVGTLSLSPLGNVMSEITMDGDKYSLVEVVFQSFGFIGNNYLYTRIYHNLPTSSSS